MSVGCVFVSVLGPPGDHEPASSALVWTVQFGRLPLFSVLLEATPVLNCSCASQNYVCSFWTNPPNTSSSEHHFTCLCQLLALAQWHCASVCPVSMVWFTSAAWQSLHPMSRFHSDWLFLLTCSQNYWERLSLNSWLYRLGPGHQWQSVLD